MMDWLNDKKNMPFVAAGLAVILIGVGLLFYFMYFRQPTPPDTTQPIEAPMGDPSAMQQPQDAGMPVDEPQTQPEEATSAPQPTHEVVKAQPMEAWRRDPFLPIGYVPPKKGPKPVPRITDFPFFRSPIPFAKKEETLPPEPVQPVRRMAGVLVNDRIMAIIETDAEDGKRTEIVKPGDILTDRLAIVEKIERDKVILKTISPRSRYLVVRMAAATAQSTVAGPDGSNILGGGVQPRSPSGPGNMLPM